MFLRERQSRYQNPHIENLTELLTGGSALWRLVPSKTNITTKLRLIKTGILVLFVNLRTQETKPKTSVSDQRAAERSHAGSRENKLEFGKKKKKKWGSLLRHSPWHSAGPCVSSAACPPAGSPSYCCHYQDNLQKHDTQNITLIWVFSTFIWDQYCLPFTGNNT